MNREELRQRVTRAASDALKAKGFVAPIDIFLGSGMLQPSQVEDWRRGRVPYLERVMRGNLKQFSEAMRVFREWAVSMGLNPSETSYRRQTRGGKPQLHFSSSGLPHIEKAYRTHYVSKALRQAKRKAEAEVVREPGGKPGETPAARSGS